MDEFEFVVDVGGCESEVIQNGRKVTHGPADDTWIEPLASILEGNRNSSVVIVSRVNHEGHGSNEPFVGVSGMPDEGRFFGQTVGSGEVFDFVIGGCALISALGKDEISVDVGYFAHGVFLLCTWCDTRGKTYSRHTFDTSCVVVLFPVLHPCKVRRDQAHF